MYRGKYEQLNKENINSAKEGYIPLRTNEESDWEKGGQRHKETDFQEQNLEEQKDTSIGWATNSSLYCALAMAFGPYFAAIGLLEVLHIVLLFCRPPLQEWVYSRNRFWIMVLTKRKT